jgi:hypothetical protein
MKEGELVAAPLSPDASSVPVSPANASHGPASVDPATARRLGLARALQLSSRLHVHVIVDHTGWLSRDVEIIYQRELGGIIHPITVRVGREASDADVLADGGALGICRKYNEALERLRQLAIRLTAVLREGRLEVRAGSELDAAQRELSMLDALVASRQLKHMGSGVVRLDRLRSEIAFFAERHAALVQIVTCAEQEAHPSWDADTEELLRHD